ncbi:MAG: hypothetical protein ACO1SV_25320 [Fimbriimonas sp.]
MGKTAKTIGIIVGVVLVLLVVRIGISMANRPDDQKLIERALAEAVEASKEGRPGGVMDLLSRNLKINNQEVGANGRDIAQFVRDQKPDVDVLEPKAQIIGEEGRIVSPVDVDFGLFGKRNLKEVTLIFKKEEGTEYLVIPVTKWRLVQVDVPEASISDFMMQ